MSSDFHRPKLRPSHVFPIFLLCLFAVMMTEAATWNFSAKIIPVIVGTGAILFCTVSLLNEVFRRPEEAVDEAEAAAAAAAPVVNDPNAKIHMDIGSNITHLPTKTILLRGAMFFGWMVGFLISMALIGLIPTVPLFIIAFMRIEGRERWTLTLGMALFMTLFIYGLFDQLLSIPWPGSFLGDYFPWFRDNIPSM
jgi:hypothetical protein